MIVEADLADSASARRSRPLFADHGRRASRIPCELMRLVRMDPDRKPDLRPERLQAPGLRGFLGVPRFQYDHRPFQPGIPGATDDVVEIRREGFVREVAVA